MGWSAEGQVSCRRVYIHILKVLKYVVGTSLLRERMHIWSMNLGMVRGLIHKSMSQKNIANFAGKAEEIHSRVFVVLSEARPKE